MQTVLWACQPVLETVTAVIMYRRKLHRQFPVFFAYLITQAVMFCILFPVKTLGYCPLYFYCYWISAGISLVFGFKVIYEIFLDVFRPYHALKDLGSMLFKWCALVMLLAAIMIAIASPAQDQPAITQAILITQRGVRVIHCGLVMLLLIFARHLGVSWKQNSFGIAFGFGFYAAVELATFALYSAGRQNVHSVGLVTTGSYCLSLFVWMGYAWIRHGSPEISANLLTPQRWNQSLADAQMPATNDSLIPMFEGMVDRAFSRTPDQSFMTAQVEKDLMERLPHSPMSDRTNAVFRSPLFTPILPTKP